MTLFVRKRSGFDAVSLKSLNRESDAFAFCVSVKNALKIKSDDHPSISETLKAELLQRIFEEKLRRIEILTEANWDFFLHFLFTFYSIIE